MLFKLNIFSVKKMKGKIIIISAVIIILGIAASINFQSNQNQQEKEINTVNRALNVKSVSDAVSYLNGDNVILARYAILGLSDSTFIEKKDFFQKIWVETNQSMNPVFQKDIGVKVITAQILLKYRSTNLEQKAYRQTIFNALDDEEQNVRLFAIWALESIADEESINKLYVLAKSNNFVIASNAITSLGSIVLENKQNASTAYQALILLSQEKEALTKKSEKQLTKTLSKIKNSVQETFDWNDFDQARLLFINGHYALAEKAIEAFAIKNNPEAQYYMAEMYSDMGGQENFKLAEMWYQKSAENGYIPAEFGLGQLFLRQEYRDYEQAIYWIKRAAEHGNLNAQKLLSEAYLRGFWGIKQDKKQSDYWSEKAEMNLEGHFQ